MDQSTASPARRPQSHHRSFSLRSDKSADKASAANTAQELAEKARRDSFLRGESKANPNAAMLEVQPGGAYCTLHTYYPGTFTSTPSYIKHLIPLSCIPHCPAFVIVSKPSLSLYLLPCIASPSFEPLCLSTFRHGSLNIISTLQDRRCNR